MEGCWGMIADPVELEDLRIFGWEESFSVGHLPIAEPCKQPLCTICGLRCCWLFLTVSKSFTHWSQQQLCKYVMAQQHKVGIRQKTKLVDLPTNGWVCCWSKDDAFGSYKSPLRTGVLVHRKQ